MNCPPVISYWALMCHDDPKLAIWVELDIFTQLCSFFHGHNFWGVEGNYDVISVKCRKLPDGGLGWKSMTVHHFDYMLHMKSELPPDMHRGHLGHNSLCINVEHLMLETGFVNDNRKTWARDKYVHTTLKPHCDDDRQDGRSVSETLRGQIRIKKAVAVNGECLLCTGG